jgi:hypothetical protein
MVAASVTQEANDKKQLVPMLEQVEAMTGSKAEEATADAGYVSEQSVTDPKLEGMDLLVAPDRQKHGEEVPCATGPPPPEAGVAERTRGKLRTVEGGAVYKMRKAVVKPVFGQIKEARGFRKFRLRGAGESAGRMGVHLRHAQSVEALPIGMEHTKGMNRPARPTKVTPRAALKK